MSEPIEEVSFLRCRIQRKQKPSMVRYFCDLFDLGKEKIAKDLEVEEIILGPSSAVTLWNKDATGMFAASFAKRTNCAVVQGNVLGVLVCPSRRRQPPRIPPRGEQIPVSIYRWLQGNDR